MPSTLSIQTIHNAVYAQSAHMGTIIYALGIQTRNSTNVCKRLLWAEGVLLCAQMGTWRNYVYPTSEKPCQNIPPKQMISLVLVFHQHTSLTTCFIHEFDFSEIGMQSRQAQYILTRQELQKDL